MSESNVEVVRSLLGPFEGLDVAGVDWGAERAAIGAGV